MFENILLGFSIALEPLHLLVLFLGVAIGLIVGALPGLNDSITIAVLIPVTFGMDPIIGMAILVGVYVSACYGGSIPAILLNIPGTASSVVTTIDGYEMAKKRQGGLALGVATTSSVFGGISSSLVLLFLAPFLAQQALKFGPAEYFSLAVMGLSTVVGMSTGSMVKSLIVSVLGLGLSLIGLSPQTGYPRFVFGIDYLYDGVPLVPMLIGLFGVSSILSLSQTIEDDPLSNVKLKTTRFERILPDRKMLKRLFPAMVIGAVIGNIIGIIPGAGMIMAIYLAYDQVKRRYPDLEFGTGVPEGVAAPEAANNGVVASSMVPLLSLGVPGNSTSALFLGALMIHGMRPGPTLFIDYPDIAYFVVVAFLIGNIMMFPMGVAMCKFLSTSILKLERKLLNGLIIILCITGAFAIRTSTFDVLIMVIFGALSFVFSKLKLPMSGIILSLILGPMIEENLQHSLTLSGGSWSIFVTKPISLALLIIAAFFLLSPIYRLIKNRIKVAKAS